jgi:tRNA 5-methylaminomethyl-2-thiouridine biosynthesis bifunctional protein
MTNQPVERTPQAFDAARFLKACDLPARWRGRDRFVVLDSRFGMGRTFLAVWDAWRHDPRRCARLHFITFDAAPWPLADRLSVSADSACPDLAAALQAACPVPTANLHRMVFEGGQVQLHWQRGELVTGLRDCVAEVDTFLLDVGSEPAPAQGLDKRVFKSLARLAAPRAMLFASVPATRLHADLAAVGFEVHAASPDGDEPALPDMTHARFAPRFVSRWLPQRSSAARRDVHDRRAVIVGGGLAGCSAAWALAEQGWNSVVLDRHDAPAAEASGNPGGLFHGIVNAQDGVHARFNRAAALQAQQAVGRAVSQFNVAGSATGLLRLNTVPTDVATMRLMLRQLDLPAAYVRAVDADEASALCGWPVPQPAWFYPGGGWVDPAGLAGAFLQRAGAAARFVGGTAVHALKRVARGWQLLDGHGAVIDEAETVVLANAGDALRLIGAPPWPIVAVRGQLSLGPAGPAARQLPLPRLPLTGAGYLLADGTGRAVFGASAQPGDMDATVRHADHADNLARLALLRGAPVDWSVGDLAGRTAWRWVAHDRLPVIGAVPDLSLETSSQTMPSRLDQPRFVPRQPGLFMFTALGSRGITWCTLGAQVLASCVSGAPVPLEAVLLDAIDPARFVSRAFRRRGGR